MLWDSGNHWHCEVAVSVSAVTCYNKRMDRVTLGFPTDPKKHQSIAIEWYIFVIFVGQNSSPGRIGINFFRKKLPGLICISQYIVKFVK